MAYEILPGPHPDIRVMKVMDDLTYEAMTADEELGLNQGRPMWVLLDVSQMNAGLPEDFLSGARHSYFVNPNLAHLSLYIKSSILRTIATMVAKVTRRKDKLSLHDSYDKAMNHLVMLMEQSKV
jgi:hypothetical protein